MVICQSANEEQNKHFFFQTIKILDSKSSVALLLQVTPRLIGLIIFIVLEEVSREKKDFFLFLLYLSGSLLCSVRFFWLIQHLGVPPTKLTVWEGKQQLRCGVSEGELSEMGTIIGSFLSDVNMPEQLRGIIHSKTPGLGKEMRPMQKCCGLTPSKLTAASRRAPSTGEETQAQVRRPSRAVALCQVPSPGQMWCSHPSRWIYRLELHWPSQAQPCVRNSLPWQPQPPNGLIMMWMCIFILHHYLLCFQKPGESRVGRKQGWVFSIIFVLINHFWAPSQPVSGI